ncbi:cellulose synthase-like protein E6 [Canna indica]|uniref:Cellulose synthase-like protein E6 n=1 Tax=Canna indica TaxID=4628 RepID=A0AAQ3QLV7_9LILI|nr:cellulose synthase-like protein E6 [Canna indica]
MGGKGKGPLFETAVGRGRRWYTLYAISVLIGLCLIWLYRATNIPEVGEKGRWAWMGMLAAEICFGFYWFITQSLRWHPVYHQTFKNRLFQRHGNDLPPVDIFVCTADPTIEPPIMVMNTVLSVMAYDYPEEKINVYVSDDGASKFTFYALLEAADFAKHWIPFCKRFNVEPRSPSAYFSSPDLNGLSYASELNCIKEMYNMMEDRIKNAIEFDHVPSNTIKQHKGFSEWNSQTAPGNHQSILQILIDGRDQSATDVEGNMLPTLVYLSREKRPQYLHNFKAGALNALIRVSSEISNSPVILNVDCDMYSNSSESVRNAMCFFLDEERGHQIGYVQFPQNFNNLDKDNIYGDYISVIDEVELPGLGDCMYLGTGCFHRRESLCGRKYSKDCRMLTYMWSQGKMRDAGENTRIIEERAKGLANCTYDQNTGWGKDIGIKYGCIVEDVVTGWSIQMNGWKSIYFNPQRKGFLGISPTTLAQLLVQHKRWSEGLFQTFLSKYCPFLYGYGKIELRLQMAYATYMLWAPMSLPTLYYAIVPSLCLLKGIPLFPRVSSTWFLVFAYVIISTHIYSLGEALCCGESLGSWWNMQRMRLMRRICSYFFGLIDTMMQTLGLGRSNFDISAKVADHEALERLEKGFMEFGSSPMFSILAAIAMLNLFSLVASVIMVVVRQGFIVREQMVLQFLLCGVLVLLNLPIYEGMFLRKDNGKLPAYLAFESSVVAALVCLFSLY